MMRIAIVHDYLTHFGGAERVLMALMDLFPNAPVYTLVYDKDRVGMQIDERRIRTSFLQKFPGARRSHRYFPLGVMPLAVEQFDLSAYDVVLSSSHSFSKGVITRAGTCHISFCFTPIRYAWDDSHRYVREFSRNETFQRFVAPAISYIRLWDYYASQRVDSYVTSSEYVAKRIQKYYGRDARVIAPPVDVDRFRVREDDDGYYLIVSRLVPYKRVDIAVDACEKLGKRLKVVGVGPEMDDLKARAGKYTEFLGFVPDEKLPELYAGAKALLFPQEEDFGITPLEAAACGKPTVAFDAGGARETIISGMTGVFFHRQRAGDMANALLELERIEWNASYILDHAYGFRRARFLDEMGAYVQDQWTLFQNER